ncbi:hypothetical protein HPP92_008666 [Vanilla planifolia]|uniref:Small ribosomal subunit protein mS35 mitochondrial conserved domain-containing protein n=1 Tax=Vanilla planifolia TaxID=51239 RepID=A0A835RB92_VANPL|nr:hypothetical protein HPP92_008864 [Vanilla planifolia]KAG0486571.1 hypothetical protein HPP92_008666 [Vanilla planifolia]
MNPAIFWRNLRHFRACHYLSSTLLPSPISSSTLRLQSSNLRFFSSGTVKPPPTQQPAQVNSDETAPTISTSLSESKKGDVRVEDVSNKEFKALIEKYFNGDEQILPLIMEAILRRGLSGKHEQTDDELIDELQRVPLDDVKDQEFESDFEELHETDEEIENLYDARQYVIQKKMKDPFFNMNDSKWDEMIKEATEQGFLKDTRECEQILEDMLSWDKLLPDEIKRKVEARYKELEDKVGEGELEPQEAYKMFKEFEDQMVLECAEIMAAEEPPPEEDETAVTDKKKKIELDDPPGEGPILRWESRVVFAPGGDAWHPKNRKVKLSVTVKELGLSKYAFRRLQEVVGKRYHSGRDELTITSERFEHREENRKDCLRTLYALIEDAVKADKLVEEARTAFIKDRLKSNPKFMARLKNAKPSNAQGTQQMPV